MTSRGTSPRLQDNKDNILVSDMIKTNNNSSNNNNSSSNNNNTSLPEEDPIPHYRTT